MAGDRQKYGLFDAWGFLCDEIPSRYPSQLATRAGRTNANQDGDFMSYRQFSNMAGSQAVVSHAGGSPYVFLENDLLAYAQEWARGERHLHYPEGDYLDSVAAARMWCVGKHRATEIMRGWEAPGARKIGRAWFILEDVAKEIAKVRQLPSNGEAARPR